MQSEVREALDRMLVLSTRSTPSLGRFQTLEALAILGEGWHSATEILRTMKEIGATTNTNYVYEVAVHFPELVESNQTKSQFRLREMGTTELRSSLKVYMGKVDNLRKSRKPKGPEEI